MWPHVAPLCLVGVPDDRFSRDACPDKLLPLAAKRPSLMFHEVYLLFRR
jgi:hypothetical protein